MHKEAVVNTKTYEIYHSTDSPIVEAYATFISMNIIRGLKYTIQSLLYSVMSSDMNKFDIKTSFTNKSSDPVNVANWYRRNPLFVSYLFTCRPNEFTAARVYKYYTDMKNDTSYQILLSDFKRFLILNIDKTGDSTEQINFKLYAKYNIKINELVKMSSKLQMIEDLSNMKCSY
jgi:hypothetical protein